MPEDLHFALRMLDEAFAQHDGVLTAEPPDYRALLRFGQLTLLTNRRCHQGIAALRKCLALPVPPGAADHAAIREILTRFHQRADGESGPPPTSSPATSSCGTTAAASRTPTPELVT